MKKVSKTFMFILIVNFLCNLAWADSEIILNPDNGHTYQRIDMCVSWHQAKLYCESLGGYLATITSWYEDDFVCNNLMSTAPGWSEACWLGGTDEETEGVWKWVTNEPWTHSHWDGGEPNNYRGGEDSLVCCTPWGHAWRFWNDVSNDSPYVPMICEWDNRLTVTCPNGGDVWLYGSVHTITWNKTGNLPNVSIEYSTTGGSYWTTIVESAPNTGSYPWVVPAIPSSNCWVRIRGTTGIPSDTNDYAFSICSNPACWVPKESMQYNMSIYGQAYNMFNLALPGDYIGAFGPGGTADCRGLSTIDVDGNYYLTIQSNMTASECENITFKLWPLSSGPSIDSSETITFIPEETYADILLHFGTREQSISLVSGWNWVSFNSIPANTALNSFFTGLIGTIEQVRTQTQTAIYSNGSWLGDLKYMNGINDGMMYKIKTKKACTLTINGKFIPYNKPLSLTSGWNWKAYLPTLRQPVARAMDSIMSQLLQVKSQNQAAVKIDNRLTGDLKIMEPGKGYVINVNANTVLTYPQGITMAAAADRDSPKKPIIPYTLIKGNKDNMAIFGKVLLDGEAIHGSGYYIIGLGPGGDSDCRSISPVGTNGSYFATILGNKNGEIIKFKLYNHSNKHTYSMSKTLIFQPDSIKRDYDLNFRRDHTTD